MYISTPSSIPFKHFYWNAIRINCFTINLFDCIPFLVLSLVLQCQFGYHCSPVSSVICNALIYCKYHATLSITSSEQIQPLWILSFLDSILTVINLIWVYFFLVFEFCQASFLLLNYTYFIFLDSFSYIAIQILQKFSFFHQFQYFFTHPSFIWSLAFVWSCWRWHWWQLCIIVLNVILKLFVLKPFFFFFFSYAFLIL